MRIPITIKIPVSVDGEASVLGGIAHVVIRDISNELEKISVRVLNRKPPANQLQRVKPIINQEIRNVSPDRFPIVYRARSVPPPQPVFVVPKVRYTVKTIHITLTWPTLPALTGLARKLTYISRKAWLRLGTAAAVIVIAIACLQLFGSHHPASKTSAAKSQSTVLQKGTPSYSTLLPAGKSITELGGWTRISPPGTDPAYTYVDKIGGIQIDVSEQPLPPNFRQNTADQIAQLAKDYSAPDTFKAGGTDVYVGTSARGPQSVILSKNNLLILIKSAAPITDDQWIAYINSLQ
jgi:hypothetical protein